LHRCVFASLAAWAASVAAAQPLRADHPLIGTWTITAPNGCTETYVVRADGTMLVTSAEEVAESELVISDGPSPRGFYKWVEKIVKYNDRKDCSGDLSAVGRVQVSYIIVHPSRDMFAMCEREDRNACIGPFKRTK
jgi:hypothetical protein